MDYIITLVSGDTLSYETPLFTEQEICRIEAMLASGFPTVSIPNPEKTGYINIHINSIILATRVAAGIPFGFFFGDKPLVFSDTQMNWAG